MSKRAPTVKDLANTWMFIALGAGSGLSPVAPGTAGSLAFLVIAPFFIHSALVVKIAILALLFAVGCYSAGYAAKQLGTHDHGAIVIDEWLGMGITLLVAHDKTDIVLGFILFRVFDILKPWPIRAIDEQVQGGLGIMLDDVLAGVFAAGALVLCQWLLPMI